MDSEEASIPIGPSSSCFELIYFVGMSFEGWIGCKFTFMHKSVLVIMQGCIGVSEQGVWIRLINKLEPILGKIK